MTHRPLVRLAVSLFAAGLGAAPLAATAGAAATAFPTSDFLTGSWNGVRDRWQQQGFSFNLNYTTESFGNVSGGEVRGGTYADNIALDFNFDLQRLLGIPNTTLLVKGSKRDGDSVSSRFIAPAFGGNTFTVQELYGGQNVKLANVQFTTKLLNDRLDLAYGRLVANDDFLRSDLYCQFVNNSFCGSPKPVFLQNPFTFTAYPLATWGARVRYDTPARVWTIQAAIYDGDPEFKQGNPASPSHNPHGVSWGMGNNGATLAGEVHYHVNRDSLQALPGVYKIGGFYLTGRFQNLHPSGANDATVRGDGMIWLLADQMLYRKSPGSPQGLSAFGALVFSLTDRVNPMSGYYNVGLVYLGLFNARPLDRTGLGLTTGWYGHSYNQGLRAAGQPTRAYEAAIELNHQFVLGHGINFQPDLQYIVRPAGTGTIPDAFAVGAKLSVTF
ncbi:carbohydrate porin [uncultured Thiodictyon sp.]|uniref:carbohydrate porin n=1 Tax=uncultured Thiodictyon sp. TaxID=1846217 RepID=UPI0025F204B3|nr:carbohydrate porin [uncultured Thiodictyon sp.]